MYDSTKSCCITYIYTVPKNVYLSSKTYNGYTVFSKRNMSHVFAKGTGSVRLYISTLYYPSGQTAEAMSEDSSTLPYVQYNFQDGILESITHNVLLPSYNVKFYVHCDGIASIEIV